MEAANAEKVRTALYRYFDADGKLLYVGISISPTYRQSQHCDASCWYESIETMRVQWFDERRAALDAERAAIKAEKPVHNVVHNRDPEPRVHQLAAESRADLNRRVARFGATYSIHEAGVATGVGESAIRWAMATGDLPYFPTGPNSVAITGWALISFLEALQAGLTVVRKGVREPDGSTLKPPNGEYLARHLGCASIDGWREYWFETKQSAMAA